MTGYPTLLELDALISERYQLPRRLADIEESAVESLSAQRRLDPAQRFASPNYPGLPPFLNSPAAVKFENVAIPNAIRPATIELNLSELSGLYSALLSERNAWMSLVEDAADTIIQLRTYFRSAAIKRAEISAGLYQNSIDDAKLNTAQLTAAKTGFEAARSLITGVFEEPAGELSANKIARASDFAGHLAALGNAQGREGASYLSGERSNLEKRTWNIQSTHNTIESERARLGLQRAIDAEAFSIKEAVFLDARDAIDELTSIERIHLFLAQGGPLDFPFFLNQKISNIIQLQKVIIPRIIQIERGLKEIFAVDSVCPRPEALMDVDGIGRWITSVEEIYRLNRRTEMPISASISLRSKSDDFVPRLRQGLSFRVDESDTFGHPMRLRGLNVVFVARQTALAKIQLQLPMANGAAGGNYNPLDRPFFFGASQNMRFASEEVKALSAERVWNLQPYGEWKIRSDDLIDANDVEDVIVLLFGVVS